MAQSRKARSSNKNPEPYWAPLPRQHFTPMQTAGIVVRHLIPVAGVLLFGWSAGQFLLLSVFSIAFSIACIGGVGVSVSMHKEAGPQPTLSAQISSWATLLLVCLGIAALLTVMFGWVIVVLAGGALFNVSLVWSALAMIASAAPALIQQYESDLRSPLSEEDRKRRDQPNVLVLALNGGLIFLMSGYAGDFGRFGLVALVIAVTALFLFRDLRPDLMREFSRPKNMPPGKEYGEAGRNHDFLQYALRGKEEATDQTGAKTGESSQAPSANRDDSIKDIDRE